MFDEILAYDRSIIFRIIGYRDNQPALVMSVPSLVLVCDFLDMEIENFDRFEIYGDSKNE